MGSLGEEDPFKIYVHLGPDHDVECWNRNSGRYGWVGILLMIILDLKQIICPIASIHIIVKKKITLGLDTEERNWDAKG